MALDVVGKARRVRIYLGEDARIGRSPAPEAILEYLRGERAQGATVLRGSSGFGATGQIHSLRLVDVAQHLPVVVEWIDRPEVIERLLPRVKQLAPGALITVDDTEIVSCEAHPVRDVPGAVPVRDVMTRELKVAAPETTVRALAESMLGQPFGAVPVVRDGVPIGIVTSGDLVRKGGMGVRLDLLRGLDGPEVHAALERLSDTKLTAAAVMTAPPVTVLASTPLPEVAALMSRRRLKRLPVVDAGGRLAGVVSRIDLLRAAAGGLAGAPPTPRALGLAADAPLSSVMRREVPVVHPETPLPEVFQAVIATRLNRALVVDAERRVVGVVTDAELLDRVTPALREGALHALVRRLPFAHLERGDPSAAQHARARTAAELMSGAFATVREEAPLGEAVALMLEGRHKILAVTDAAGRLAGVVDRADLLQGLAPA